jgi:hypothetical protein
MKALGSIAPMEREMRVLAELEAWWKRPKKKRLIRAKRMKM